MSTYDAIKIEGKTEGRKEVILALHEDGIGIEQLAKAAKLTIDQVIEILKKHGKII